MAVYFFYGDEDFNIELELQKLSSKLNPDFKAMNYQEFDNPEYSVLVNALRTPPMMFGDMLIVINSTSIQLIPTTIVAIRTAHSASSDIILPTLISTFLSTFIGIVMVKIFVKNKK